MKNEVKKYYIDQDKRKKRWFCVGGIVISAAIITSAVLLTRYLTIKTYRSAVTLTFNAGDGVFEDTQLNTYQLKVEKTTKFKDIVNRVNQPALANYVFEGWKSGNKIVDDFVINDDVVLNASYIAPDPKSFATDSWSTLACIANQGLDKLKEVYQPNGGTFVITDEDDTMEEIAAKTRSVNFDSLGSFKVRVIGENHDYLSSSDKNDKVAALTFEFSEIINPAVPDKYREFEDYITSGFRHYMQDDIYCFAPADLRSNLRLVKKEVISPRVRYVIDLDEYFFALSFAEIANPQTYSLAYVQEGSIYEYYQNPNHSIKKLYHNDEDYNFYRLRSLDENRFASLLSVIDEDISNSYAEPLAGGCGIAPGFCIGETKLTDANSCLVTWDGAAFKDDANFLADLKTYDGSIDTVLNGYVKMESKSSDFIHQIRIPSSKDLHINLVASTDVYGFSETAPDSTLLKYLEAKGYSFVKIGGVPQLITNEDYDVKQYEYYSSPDTTRSEIIIPAEKLTGNVELSLFSYSVAS